MNKKPLPYCRAICYSGYRDGQSPESGEIPTYEQVKQDLLILQDDWQSLRLYAIDAHTETVLAVIRNEKMSFDVMLGAYITAEVNNEECPWGGVYSPEQLLANKAENVVQIKRLIELTNAYEDIVSSASIGNEASVSWTDHMVTTESLIRYARLLKAGISKPITFCENYVPWLDKLKPLAEELDVIAIHTYPVWEYKGIEEGLAYTIENYKAVAKAYPDKQIIITEAGWATNANGFGIDPENVNEEFQEQYYQELMAWAEKEQVLVYYFEAFDENWKGSDDPLEPEKHWGLYRADRTPKLALQL